MTTVWVGVLGMVIVTFAFICPLFFSRKQAGYSAIQHTLSELGAQGTRHQRAVAYGYFLPLGCAIAVYIISVMYFAAPNEAWFGQSRLPLSLFGWVSIGYIIAALFPCDPGAPIKGSPRNQIHNVAGALEYLGAGAGFILLGLSLDGSSLTAEWVVPLVVSGLAILFLLLLLFFPVVYLVRGLIQRIAELVFFGWMLFFSAYLVY